MKWRWLGLIAGVAVLGVLLWTASQSKGTPVDVAEVQVGTIRAYVEERGKTRLPDIVQITMPLQGRVLGIELEEGDHVSEGQVVARMDPADLETELKEAQNTVERYNKNLEQVQMAVQQAEQTVLASQSKYDFAEKEFGRIQELYRRGATSESNRHQAELTMIESRVELRKNELNKSMYGIGERIMELMRESELANLAKLQRDRRRMEIVSPVSGVVLSRAESDERVLQAGTVLMEIGDLAQLEVEADVLTQDALTIAIGDPADIETAGLGEQPVQGQVNRIFPQGFTKVSSLGVEQQRVRVVIGLAPGELERLLEEQRPMGVDYHVRVRIYTDQQENTLIAPRGAFFRGGDGQWQTFVVRDDRARLVPVKLGTRTDYEVEVLDGLVRGERVVLAPDSTLADDQPVEPSS
jgi:HlyD family secretion protein